MPFLNLPNEVLLLVAKNLSKAKDLNSLLRTSTHLCSLLTPQLHKLALEAWYGLKPLAWAVIYNHQTLVLLLLCLGVDINEPIREPRGLYALHYCILRNREDMFRLLLSNGADVTVRDTYGQTPLHLAAAGGELDMVKLLLEHAPSGGDAYVDLREVNGHTALWGAALLGQENVCKFLLKCGADIMSRSNSGETASMAARMHHHRSLENLLRGLEEELST